MELLIYITWLCGLDEIREVLVADGELRNMSKYISNKGGDRYRSQGIINNVVVSNNFWTHCFSYSDNDCVLTNNFYAVMNNSLLPS